MFSLGLLLGLRVQNARHKSSEVLSSDCGTLNPKSSAQLRSGGSNIATKPTTSCWWKRGVMPTNCRRWQEQPVNAGGTTLQGLLLRANMQQLQQQHAATAPTATAPTARELRA